ncbi:MAG: hypothetical protein L0213_10715, partial [Candidatus Dadabacteria bacterium]|nr:hypothetical protein [Candidatus Dadabacteria bacterium]
SQATLTLDGNSRIITREPEHVRLNIAQVVKTLTVMYRRNGKTGEYMHTLSRPANSLGVEKVIELPLVYSHETADRFCDYWRKRYQGLASVIDLEVGEEVKTLTQGQAVTLDIPHSNIQNELWEIIQTRAAIAGAQGWRLIKYVDAYTYESGTTESDVGFDIPPDYTLTNPDPIANAVVTYKKELDEEGHLRTFAILTFDIPEENYDETRVSIRENGATDWDEAGRGYDRVRIPVTPGFVYDYQLVSYNAFGLDGIAILISSSVVPGDTTIPKAPTSVIGKGSLSGATWEFNAVTQNTDNSAIQDLKGYEYRVWSAASGGTQLYPKAAGWGFIEDAKLEIQAEDINSSSNPRNLYAEFRAVDFSGNTSTTTARVVAFTGRATSIFTDTGSGGTGP